MNWFRAVAVPSSKTIWCGGKPFFGHQAFAIFSVQDRIWKCPRCGQMALAHTHPHTRYTTHLNLLPIKLPVPEWAWGEHLSIGWGNWCHWLSRAKTESASRKESCCATSVSCCIISLWKGYQGHCWNTSAFSKSCAISVSSCIFQDSLLVSICRTICCYIAPVNLMTHAYVNHSD